jgi:hypothetical protein
MHGYFYSLLSQTIRKFIDKLSGDVTKLKKPLLIEKGKTWVLRLKDGSAEFRLSERGEIRQQSGKRETKSAVKSLNWTQALTHCILAYRDYKTQANAAKLGSPEWRELTSMAADWYAGAFICELAGGTTAKGFEIEPSRNDLMGMSRTPIPGGEYVDRFFMNDNSNETGDEKAEYLDWFTRYSADAPSEVHIQEHLAANTGQITPQDVEEGCTTLGMASATTEEFSEGDEGSMENDQEEIDAEEDSEVVY